MATLIQLKRFSNSEIIENSNYVPAEGEPVFDLNSNILYIGDGVKKLSELPQIGGNSISSLNITTEYLNSGSLNNYFEQYLECDAAGIIRWNIETVKIISAEISNAYTYNPLSSMCDYALNFEYTGGDITQISRLPNGMNLDIWGGRFYGTPTESGSWYFDIKAACGNLTSEKKFLWSVN